MLQEEKNQQNLEKIFQLQKKAFALSSYPEHKQRKDKLKNLQAALLTYEEALMLAVSEDFGYRSHKETWLTEIFQVTSTIKYVLKHLRQWMHKDKRHTSFIFKPAKNYVYYQPLGVIGIMVPWNYPILLSLSPLVYALAAGNRVLLKLSEHTPRTNKIIQEICKHCFSTDEVAVIDEGGDIKLAQAFTQLPFDHLFFTGSTKTGKKVMQAAADHLTPVTLELGGKSPLIISHAFSLKKAAKMIVFAKGLNAGQTCIAPDYLLVHEQKIEVFVNEMKKAFTQMYPHLEDNRDYSSIINDTQFERLKSYLSEAQTEGVRIISLQKTLDLCSQNRKMPVFLLINPCMNLAVMQNEIFGPLLPIISYKSIDEAVNYINRHSQPLATYLFSFDKKEQEYVTKNTVSGGMCINDLLNQIAQHDLPFGGVGGSGVGRYHAFEGFKTFSNAKAVYQKGRVNAASLLYPPYGKRFQWFQALFKNG